MKKIDETIINKYEISFQFINVKNFIVKVWRIKL